MNQFTNHDYISQHNISWNSQQHIQNITEGVSTEEKIDIKTFLTWLLKIEEGKSKVLDKSSKGNYSWLQIPDGKIKALDKSENRQSSSRAAVSVNTARSINTAYTKPIVNSARPASNVFNRAHPHVRNPFNKFTTNNNSNFNKKVNTVRGHVTTARLKAVNTARPNSAVVNAVRANQGNHILEFQEKRVINNGCSRHMTGNKSYLSDYEEIDGGFVSFGGNPKGGKITRKATKDETSGILKAFITGIENQINHRVKIIRCDNGTKFKNKEMNQFSEMKGIKREFRVARTPQQNGVAERKNKTLIEAARTMLADSKLPTTFWLSKFDGKADEGLFIRYSVNRNGPEWLFDIDTLTKSMNYKAVVAGNETNGNAGTKESIDIGQAGKKTVPSHKYILLPLWTSDSYISTSLKSSDHEVTDGVAKKSTEDLVKEGDQDDQDLRDEFASEYERLIVQGVKGDILLVQVYVDDIIFGSTKKELCTEFEKLMHKKFQMSSMGELTFFLGLQIASTPMETSKPLLKNAKAEDVDVHLY
ncbi:ribonuclease H-like domain-containing protein [Tanacetum coccineum]